MITLVILFGFYLILSVGSFKMLKRRSKDLFDEFQSWHVYFGLVTVAAAWPLGVTWTLVKEAIR